MTQQLKSTTCIFSCVLHLWCGLYSSPSCSPSTCHSPPNIPVFPPSSTMSTYFPPLQPSSSLPTCGAIKCNDHGVCVAPHGGGADLVCDCKLGYQGKSCEETVNGALSIPLTLSVLAVVIGLVSLAFILAKIRRERKKKHRRHLAAKHGYNVVV